MVVYLTDEQRQALQTGTAPARFVDPQTNETYVLLPERLYEQVRPLVEQQTEPPCAVGFEVPPGIQRAKEAFLRDLPELLINKKIEGWWVLYHLDQRVGVFRNAEDLYREWRRRALRDDEVYMGNVCHHEPEPEEIERSLVEFDDDSPTSGPQA